MKMLDDTDKNILRILQEDGSISLSKIANKLNIGIATVHRRIEKMKMEGVIKKNIVVVDPEKIGKNLSAFIEIKSLPKYEDDILDTLSLFDDILEIYWVTGDADFIIKLIVEDIKEFTKIMEKIRKIEGIVDTRSFIIAKTEKEEYKIKI
ncbi:AsnC family transcriptional regulator [Thermococci archaeon]|nr:MAG: AsnC family transcriptional regulator [Thermococci archaeon]